MRILSLNATKTAITWFRASFLCLLWGSVWGVGVYECVVCCFVAGFASIRLAFIIHVYAYFTIVQCVRLALLYSRNYFI